MLERLARDVRYATRQLMRAPVFAATAIGSLAIGVGATTAIFTVANGLLLTPTHGLRDMDRLVDIGRSTGGHGFDTVSFPTYLDVRDRASVFDGVYAMRFGPEPMSLAGDTGAERIYGEQVSASYFDVIGLTPARGAFFHTPEEQLGVPLRKVVLSDGFWRRRFNADPAVVGRDLTLNGDHFQVAGVAPAGFLGTTILAPDLWVPLTAYAKAMPDDRVLRGRENSGFIMGARLKAGVSVDQAAAAVRAVFAQMTAEYPAIYTDRGLVVLPASRLPGVGREFVAPFLALLMTVVCLVLLIACANLTGLMLARATSRSREIAVRLALGASRRGLVFGLIVESLLLFLAGAAAGTALARLMTTGLLSLIPSLPFPVTVQLPLDWRVLAFTTTLALLTGVLTGLVPALQSLRTDLVADLKSDHGTPRRLRWRNIFIAAQLALCVILIVVAGLFLRALGTALSVDPGFDVDRVEVATIDFSIGGYSPAEGVAVSARLLEQFAAIPGVVAVGAARVTPLEGNSLGLGALRRPGADVRDRVVADWNVISPEFLPTLGIPMTRGRNFSAADGPNAPRVAVVNESLAKHVWAGEDPVGQVLEVGEFRPGHTEDIRRLTIVGVARDAKYKWLGEAPADFIYVPLAQEPTKEVNILLRRDRAVAGSTSLAPSVRQRLKQIDPNLPLVRMSSLRQLADLGLLPQRIAASVAGSLGTVALVLAAIGLYGLTAFTVARRTREIGVRMALGADRGRIMRVVMWQALKLTTIGASIGLVIAAALTRLLSGLLFGVSAIDPIAFGSTVAALALTAAAASYVPARRAANVDPLVALRTD